MEPLEQRIVQKIYTKTGDKGMSSLFNGDKRSKNDTLFEVLGTIDELSSAIGVAKEFCGNHTLRAQLEDIQRVLLDVGSSLATPRDSSKSTKSKLGKRREK
jgi:cob(I)alamin adenosyltransferase